MTPPLSLGIVVIGRNEGDRLATCLRSANHDGVPLIYVDSGSTDGSVGLAKELGAHVVELDMTQPFTAARARNEGFARLMELNNNLEFVQFVDGDCQIAPGWIDAAIAEISRQPKTAVICGRRRERFPTASIYNRLSDMEWNTPIGPAKACGGDALIRTSAFTAVHGYDPTIIAGEEPELCVRLRQAGWNILRIDAQMTLHDAAMKYLSQWWKRNIRAGHAYAQGFAMHGTPPERFRAREVRSIRIWVIGPLLATGLAIALLCFIHPRFAGFGLLPLIFYVMLWAKIVLQRKVPGERFPDRAVYAASVVLGKFPQYLGMRKFRSAQQNGRQSSIIEYKRIVSQPSQ